MSYFYNGVNIGYLVQNGSTPVPNYGGFPQSTPYQYTSGFDKPANFSYTIGTTDVSNYSQANFSSPIYGGGDIPLAISNTGYYFKTVSVCGCGGGGGGGAGGYPGNAYGGGSGGSGGDGSYAAILNFQVPSGTTNLSYNIGTGGGGSGGVSPNGKGQDGLPGYTTVVSITSTNIIVCPGGNGGEGGGPGNASNKSPGPDGSKGNSPDSSIAPGYTGIVSTSDPTYSTYPPQTGNYAGPTTNNGGGGGGGNGPYVNANNAGNTGNAGFILVYFTYQ